MLGSLPSGGPGQVVIGSTAESLLHASPVPVAISPRKYRSAHRQVDTAHVRLLGYPRLD